MGRYLSVEVNRKGHHACARALHSEVVHVLVRVVAVIDF